MANKSIFNIDLESLPRPAGFEESCRGQGTMKWTLNSVIDNSEVLDSTVVRSYWTNLNSEQNYLVLTLTTDTSKVTKCQCVTDKNVLEWPICLLGIEYGNSYTVSLQDQNSNVLDEGDGKTVTFRESQKFEITVDNTDDYDISTHLVLCRIRNGTLLRTSWKDQNTVICESRDPLVSLNRVCLELSFDRGETWTGDCDVTPQIPDKKTEYVPDPTPNWDPEGFMVNWVIPQIIYTNLPSSKVRVFGHNLNAASTCKFVADTGEEFTTTPIFHTNEYIECPVPDMTTVVAKTALLQLRWPEYTSFLLQLTKPSVTSISPTSGFVHQDLDIRIAGKFMNSPTLHVKARFGDNINNYVILDCLIISDELIIIKAPLAVNFDLYGTRIMHLYVSVNGIDYTQEDVQYTYVDPPNLPEDDDEGLCDLYQSAGVISDAWAGVDPDLCKPNLLEDFTPKEAHISGGSVVEITGNFTTLKNKDFKVYIGPEALNVTLLGELLMTVVTPSVPAETTVSIELHVDDEVYSTGKNEFMYKLYFNLTSITPTSGPSRGGTVVQFTGTNFDFDVMWVFGDQYAAPITISQKRIDCKSTPNIPGDVEVNVAIIGIYQTDSNITYTYYKDISILSISPRAVPIKGVHL